MAAFERAKSGIPGLDKALDNIRLGDNVVWNVTNLHEFSYFVDPYVKQAKEDNRNLIYIRFANHEPLIEMTDEDYLLLEFEEKNPDTEFCMIERDGIKIYKVNPPSGGMVNRSDDGQFLQGNMPIPVPAGHHSIFPHHSGKTFL